MNVERIDATTLHAWHAMRALLWPDPGLEDVEECAAMLESANFLFLVAKDDVEAIGFAEGSIRNDYVNGCETTPVVFLEGIYVLPEHRKRGVARALCLALAQWGRDRGCKEFASDALLDNLESHAMHRALGFEETERVVCFRKIL